MGLVQFIKLVVSRLRPSPHRKVDIWVQIDFDFKIDWFAPPPSGGNGSEGSTPGRRAAKLRDSLS
jgi:hypothetical protein